MNNTEKSAHAGHSKSSHFLLDLPLPTRAVWTPLGVQVASPEAGFSLTTYLAPSVLSPILPPSLPRGLALVPGKCCSPRQDSWRAQREGTLDSEALPAKNTLRLQR